MPNNKWVCTYTGRLFSALSTPQSRTGLLVWPPLSARRNHGIDTQLCRHFTTDDTSDRFRHVRDALPRRDPIPEDPVLVAPTELPVERSFEPEAKEPEAKLDRDTLRSIPLETIEDALLKFVPENIRDSSPDDEFLTPGQIFYLENRDKLFDNIRRRYLEETGGKDAAALTDNDIESLLPLLMEDEQYGSYDAEQVVSPGKHHLWDYNTSEVASTSQQRRQERMANVVVVDMDSCNRRDQAMYCIVATGSTRAHCRYTRLTRRRARAGGSDACYTGQSSTLRCPSSLTPPTAATPGATSGSWRGSARCASTSWSRKSGNGRVGSGGDLEGENDVLVGQLPVHRGEGLQLVLDVVVLLVLGVKEDAEHAASVALDADDLADDLGGRCDILKDGLVDAGQRPVPGPDAELLATAAVDAAHVGRVDAVGHEYDHGALLERADLDLLAVGDDHLLHVALQVRVAAGLDVKQALGNLQLQRSWLVLAHDLFFGLVTHFVLNGFHGTGTRPRHRPLALSLTGTHNSRLNVQVFTAKTCGCR
ncbi:oligomerization domain protein [Babesia caballi]|uniref:Oligomerization domain protein n=1 Tax=Babesia caballi TaxID=5871 RepID=A0AAV4LND9_BABCB|nr:oligomerization domain protein [Babesia caballi]